METKIGTSARSRGQLMPGVPLVPGNVRSRESGHPEDFHGRSSNGQSRLARRLCATSTLLHTAGMTGVTVKVSPAPKTTFG